MSSGDYEYNRGTGTADITRERTTRDSKKEFILRAEKTEPLRAATVIKYLLYVITGIQRIIERPKNNDTFVTTEMSRCDEYLNLIRRARYELHRPRAVSYARVSSAPNRTAECSIGMYFMWNAVDEVERTRRVFGGSTEVRLRLEWIGKKEKKIS